MPELPEVQTTVNGLNEYMIGHKIIDVWSNYNSPYWKGASTIKDRKFFSYFKKQVLGKRILKAKRRAKNILIDISGGQTILIHLKMTGHLLYGKYIFHKKTSHWNPIEPESLKDPFNKHIRFVLTLDKGKHLALCDTRRFAKVTLIDTDNIHSSIHLKKIGPEPLDNIFTFDSFMTRIGLRPNTKIKQVLLDQTIIAGIGNIYADESLWRAGIHPASIVKNIPESKTKLLFHAIRKTLKSGIDFGGDSMSDYRNILGEKGRFQEKHKVYRRKGNKCEKRGCKGIIKRLVIAGRGTHLCTEHQTLF